MLHPRLICTLGFATTRRIFISASSFKVAEGVSFFIRFRFSFVQFERHETQEGEGMSNISAIHTLRPHCATFLSLWLCVAFVWCSDPDVCFCSLTLNPLMLQLHDPCICLYGRTVALGDIEFFELLFSAFLFVLSHVCVHEIPAHWQHNFLFLCSVLHNLPRQLALFLSISFLFLWLFMPYLVTLWHGYAVPFVYSKGYKRNTACDILLFNCTLSFLEEVMLKRKRILFLFHLHLTLILSPTQSIRL